MKKRTAELILLITAIFWGFGYIGVDILLSSGMNPILIIGLRFLIASVFLSIIFIKKIKINANNIIGSIVIGSSLYLAFVFQTIAMEHTTTTNVSFLTGINIVFVPILIFVLFHKKVKTKNIVSIFITIIGIGLLTGGLNSFNRGDFLAILGALFFGLHIVLISYYSKKSDIINLSIGQMLVVTIFSFLTIPFLDINIYYEISNINILVLLFVGIIPSALCFLLQNIGLKYTEESRGSIILATESLWGAVFAIIFLKESLTLSIIASGILFSVAILIDEVNFKKDKIE